MKRIVMIALSVLLAGFLVFMSARMQKEAQSTARRASVYRSQLSELQEARIELKETLAALEDEAADAEEDSDSYICTVSLLIDGLGKSTVYDELYPVMKARGMTGILVLTPERMPDMEGCMSLDAFRELLDAGWDYCLYWDGNSDPNDMLAEMEALLDEAGLQPPDMIWTGSTADIVRYGELLYRNGITMMAAPSFISTEEERELWLAVTANWASRAADALIEDAVEDRTGVALTVQPGTAFDGTAFAEKLDELAKLRSEDSLIVGSHADFWAYWQAVDEEREQARIERQAEMESLQAQIEDLDAQIDDLRISYYPEG